ncbi:MAG: magnesium transporter CorA family protein [Spirochaetaceae bacterium]|jgi:magnesium transporter|nr:magnesium transporter CorA family protein [Spirochaetaceae bacterium]
MIEIRIHEGNQFVSLKTPVKDCWIDAKNVDKDDLNRLQNEFGVPAELLVDVMDSGEQARIEIEDDWTLIIVRLPVSDPSMEVPCFTIPLGVILFPDKIVTVCSSYSNALEDLACNRVRIPVMRNQSAFVLRVLERSAITFLRFLNEINKSASEIEKNMHTSISNHELLQLFSLQKSLVYFATSIKSNELLLERMQKSSVMLLKEEDKDLLEDVIIENIQAMEQTTIYSSILKGTMDTFGSIINNNLNNEMKRLAIVNIVLMIPTLTYSFYGMNITLPFAYKPLAVAGVFVFSLTISLLGVIILKFASSRKIIKVKKHKH